MSRWFRSIRVAGYPTRYEQECEAWSNREASVRVVWLVPPGSFSIA